MTDPNITADAPDRERRRAADLRTGDRIVPGDLLGATRVEEVLGVYPFPEKGEAWVMVVYREVGDTRIFTHYYRANNSIALAAAAEPDLPTDVEGVAPGAAIGRATVPEGGA